MTGSVKYVIASAFFLICGTTCLAPIRPSTSLRSKHFSSNINPCYWPKKGKNITIFVHGGGKPISCVLAIPGFYTACPRGFVPYESLGSGCSSGKNIARELNKADPDMFPLETFYVFGWSGFLSFSERRQEGRNLYKVISQLRDDPRYQDAFITIITHSEGGNLAANIALGACEYNDMRMLVNRLIITACPVVVNMQELIESPVFEEVLVLFSKSDAAQVLDLQGLAPVSSRKARCAPFFFGQKI